AVEQPTKGTRHGAARDDQPGHAVRRGADAVEPRGAARSPRRRPLELLSGMGEPQVLMTGIAFGESPRWHDGRLWFANWGAQEIVAVDLQGNSEVIAHSPTVAGYSIDWLPDGSLLMTGQELLRQEADGSLVTHADLSGLSRYGWNEIVVDGRANIYVNSVGFQFGQEEFRPGIVALITPDGSVRQVADSVAFPNGLVVTPEYKTMFI